MEAILYIKNNFTIKSSMKNIVYYRTLSTEFVELNHII